MTELIEPTISKRKIAKPNSTKKKPVQFADKLSEQVNSSALNQKADSGPAGNPSRAARYSLPQASIANDIDSNTASTDSDETPCFVKGYN